MDTRDSLKKTLHSAVTNSNIDSTYGAGCMHVSVAVAKIC
jgi:hypothetical protein